MTKRKARAKKTASKQDRAEFERQVAELGAALNKLPADRQEQLERELGRSSREKDRGLNSN
jgi:hypothetical protein